MVYWKLDNQTIRCLINKEEIKKMGFDLNALSNDADTMTAFLEAIVNDSRNYVDWNTENGVQIYIAKALPADQFLFTISCCFPDDMINKDLKQIRRMITALNAKISLDRIEEIERLSGEEKEKAFADLSKDLRDVCMGEIPPDISFEEQDEESLKNNRYEKTAESEILSWKLTFAGMSELIDFCLLLDDTSLFPASLYRLKDDYILLMDFDKADDRRKIIKFLTSAEEYGAVCESSELSRFYILEHGERLIDENAIQVLRKLAR